MFSFTLAKVNSAILPMRDHFIHESRLLDSISMLPTIALQHALAAQKVPVVSIKVPDLFLGKQLD